MTRRRMVSAVYSLFNPLGFIAPYIMKAKLLLQTLRRKKTEKAQWNRWLDDLPKLEEVKVDRCFRPREFVEVKETQLHLFSDASPQGYASVAYLCLKDTSDQIH